MRRILLTAVLLLAACSSNAGPSVATAGGAPASSKPATGKAEANRQFAGCMREHGAEVPDPGPDGELDFGPDVDRAKVTEAMPACEKLLPGGGTLSQLSPEQLEQARQFAKCMREHGIDMPDPDPATGVSDLMRYVGKPGFQEAAAACKGVVGR
ncbi:hypothetical protein [Dactylosporangium sp. NPDC005555]|uniref:hypothetical protein n=1 Tax=Dactylosporangium sp. NPDC005555 TaxID=3154889 RepID=UPI0033B64F8E